MKFDRDDAESLRPLLAELVADVYARVEAAAAKTNGRIAYSESEAAELLGVPPDTLAERRKAGEIAARKCGRYWLYTRGELLRFAAQREN